MINLLITVAVLFALGTIALYVGKVVRNIIVFCLITGVGAAVWIYVLPHVIGDVPLDSAKTAVESLSDGVAVEVMPRKPVVDDDGPQLPKLPEVSIKDAFNLRPEIEGFVMTALSAKIEELKSSLASRGGDIDWPEVPETKEEFERLTVAQREQLKKQVFELFSALPTSPSDDSTAEVHMEVPDVAVTEFSGEFVRVDGVPQRTSGTARVLTAPDGKALLSLEDFSVTNGPDLMVYLCISPIGDVRVGFVSLGELKAISGDQTYAINTKAALSGFRSVVIYSDTLEVAYGVAPLNP